MFFDACIDCKWNEPNTKIYNLAYCREIMQFLLTIVSMFSDNSTHEIMYCCFTELENLTEKRKQIDSNSCCNNNWLNHDISHKISLQVKKLFFRLKMRYFQCCQVGVSKCWLDIKTFMFVQLCTCVCVCLVYADHVLAMYWTFYIFGPVYGYNGPYVFVRVTQRQ